MGSTLDGYVGAATQVVKAAELVARQTAHSGECQWALTGKRALTGGGALKLLEHAVLLDAARDDDGGVETKPLAREVDLLGRLRTLELGDRKRVTVDTATRGEARCQWALSERRTLGAAAALQLLEHAALLDAGRDDDGRGNAEPLIGEVDLLSTLQLVDLKRVTVEHTAKGKRAIVSGH